MTSDHVIKITHHEHHDDTGWSCMSVFHYYEELSIMLSISEMCVVGPPPTQTEERVRPRARDKKGLSHLAPPPSALCENSEDAR